MRNSSLFPHNWIGHGVGVSFPGHAWTLCNGCLNKIFYCLRRECLGWQVQWSRRKRWNSDGIRNVCRCCFIFLKLCLSKKTLCPIGRFWAQRVPWQEDWFDRRKLSSSGEIVLFWTLRSLVQTIVIFITGWFSCKLSSVDLDCIESAHTSWYLFNHCLVFECKNKRKEINEVAYYK